MKTTAGGRLVRVLAWRRLTTRPLRSCLTAAGVAVGVAFLFSIMSLNAQLGSAARDTAALLSGPRLLQVVPASPGGLPEALAGQLADDDRVAAAAPLLVTRATVSNGSRDTGAFVVAGTPAVAALAPGGSMASTDQLPLAREDGGVVLGRDLARRLRVAPGGDVTVHASTGKTRTRVAGVASSPVLDRINGGMVAAMPLARAQEVFGRTGRVDQIMLLAAADADLDALRRDVAASIEGIGLVGSPGEALGAGSEFAMVQLVTNFTGALVVMAAIVLVFHTMSMATAERRTEIALARSLGSTRRQLLLVTLAEAGMLGGAGTVAGLVGGGVLGRLVVPLARFAYGGGAPVDLPTDVTLQLGPAVAAAAAGIAGSVLGAVVPARSASRAAPIDAFRPTAAYEWRDPTRPARRAAIAAGGAVLVAAGVAVAARATSRQMNDPAMAFPAVAVFGGALILTPTAVSFAGRAAAVLLERLSTTTGRLAGDALRANPRRTTVNVMALLLPVSILVMTATAFDAGGARIRQLARANVGAPLNVDADSYVGGPASPVASQPLASTQRTVLQAVPGVRAVLPYQNANIRLPDGSPGVIYAIPLTEAERAGVAGVVQVSRVAAVPITFAQTLAAGEIAASRFAARSLDLAPGSRLTLPTKTGARTFTVGALFDDWAFRGTFYVDYDTYRSVWGDDGAYRYAIVPTAGTSLDELRQHIQEAVTTAAIPAHVSTRDEAVAELETNTTAFFPLFRAMTVASLVFAALALANAAFTAVTERRWLFALQRTLGMTSRQIGRSLALEAITIGLIGTIGAAVVGLSLGSFMMRIMANQLAITIAIAIPWTMLAISAVLGVAVALGATHYPRRTATRVPIVETLRFD